MSVHLRMTIFTRKKRTSQTYLCLYKSYYSQIFEMSVQIKTTENTKVFISQRKKSINLRLNTNSH